MQESNTVGWTLNEDKSNDSDDDAFSAVGVVVVVVVLLLVVIFLCERVEELLLNKSAFI